MVPIESSHATSYWRLILTDILSRTVSKLLQIIVHILDEKRPLCVSEPFGGLGVTYAVHPRLIVDFLFVLIELVSLGVTPEALRANIYWKSAFLKGVDQFRSKIQVEGDIHHKPFLNR